MRLNVRSCLSLLVVLATSIFIAPHETQARDAPKIQYPITFVEMKAICEAKDNGSGIIQKICREDPEFSIGNDDPVTGAFLTALLTQEEKDDDVGTMAVMTSEREAAGALGLLSLDQSAILYGLSDFLIERAEVEAQAFLLDRFAEDLCNAEIKVGSNDENELTGKDVLPRTCTIFDDDLEGITLVTGSGSVLRTTLREDLFSLPTSLAKTGVEKTDNDDLFASLFLVATVIERVYEGEGIIPAIQALEDPTTSLPDLDPSVFQSGREGLSRTQALFLMSRLFLAFPVEKDIVQVPKTADQWKNVIRATYLNVQHYHENMGQRDVFFKAMEEAVSDVTDLQRLEPKFDALDRSIKRLKASVEADTTEDLRAARLQNAGRVMADGLSLLLSVEQTFPDRLLQKKVADGRKQRDPVDILAQMGEDLAAQDYPSLSTHTILLAAALGMDLPGPVKRAVLLGGDLTGADDAESAKAAIEAFAAPPGGYLRKRDGGAYVSLNAYVGALFANENALGVNENTSFTVSAYAPLGFEIGHTVRRGSIGAFLQVIDVGAITAYRFEQEGVEEVPEIGFRQVLSPGIYLVYGLPGAPASIMAGVSRSPNLRTVQLEEEEDTFDVVRYGFSISFDIPIFP